MTVAAFVDVEQLVIVWLSERLPDVRVVQNLPSALDNVIRVTRSPAAGPGPEVGQLPRVDVECFSSGGRVGMWQLAGRANNAMAELACEDVTVDIGPDGSPEPMTVRVDDVSTVTDPVPGYWSPTVERSVAVYELDVRTAF